MTSSMSQAGHAKAPAVVLLAVLAGVVVAGVIGCGEGHRYAPVAGVVTYNGTPIEGARVVFQPVQGEPGSGSTGTTDAEGRFELSRLSGDGPGARVTTHRVTMTMNALGAAANESTPMPSDPMPTRLRDGSARFEVPAEGTASANFAVEDY